ncbi:MAG TPA: hypothetical protein P5110_07795 [Candidatus Omnitrophota bacterium]|nr:hypothetical protein [Candidatus Omnitrophota bacterium]HRZ15394.1 hypothetical protein [Candidatus Omnitrophota bacterium]
MIDQTKIVSWIQKNIINLVVLGVLIVVAVIVYQKKQEEIAALRVDIETAQKTNQILAELGGLEKKAKELRKVINVKDPQKIVDKLNGIAKQAGVTITSLKPKTESKAPQDPNKPFIRYAFDVVVSAENYHANGKFISLLEQSPDMYTVDRMGFRPIYKDEGNKFRLEITMEISTIMMKED